MAATSLLRAFLAIVKALLASCKRLVNETRVSLLQKVAYLWTLLRSRLSGEKTTKSIDREKGRKPQPPPATIPESNDYTEKPTTSTTATTTTTQHQDVIPLDSTISCSLQPYPYLNRSRNGSRASLNLALHAARSAHTSRNASRSTQHLALDSPCPSDTHSYQEGYTFTVKSPDTPLSPITRRQYSLSSPQLGSGPDEGSGGGTPDGWGIEMITRTHSSSPADSILALPAGVPSIHGESLRDDLSLGHDRIFPIMPEFFQRYERFHFAEKKETDMTIHPFTLDFRPQSDPPDWTPIVHPEGVLYFYNEKKKAVTEANLYDHTYLEQVNLDIATLEDFIRAKNISMPKNYTLAMDLNMQPRGVIYTDYYFADHDKKIVFFLDNVEAQANLPAWGQLAGVTSYAHLKHEIEAQYWLHCSLYPTTVELTAGSVAELRDTILHYLGDFMTSQYSTSPYNVNDLNTMLGQVNNLRKNIGFRSVGAVSLLSRMMHIFARQKFLNWHGVPEARICRDQSVHGDRQHKSLLIKTLSPLLFSAPDIHLRNLEKMWVDGIMHAPVWLQSINKLNEEWQEFILYATVLLNANVAFLAIQSIDVQPHGYRSPVQVGCYVSIVASIGSVIIGLLLLRQNRTRAHGTIEEVNLFLKARSHPTLGLETLAILYSLPYALLLWGMLSFLAAFGWCCFDGSTIATRVVVGAASVILITLIMWCVWMGWVKQPSADEASGSEGDPDPVTSDAQSHISRISRSGPGAASRMASRHSLVTPRPVSRMSRASKVSFNVPVESTVGELKPAGFWRNWSEFFRFGAHRRSSYDSQRTVVGTPPSADV